MARPGTRRRGTRTAEVRRRLVEATIEELKASGYAGTSARAIATRAEVSQALVFYHFRSIDELLLAALDETSDRRMRAYRDAMEAIRTIQDLFEVASRIYREDLADGHLKVLAELIAASSSNQALASRVSERLDPWIDLTAATLEQVFGPSPILGTADTRQLATGVVGLYLGLELITHLKNDEEPASTLFSTARALAGQVTPPSATQ
jgi:AcrR family transcriptional regulator